MAKHIILEIDGKGGIHVEYGGFVGNECFVEAERLRLALDALGVSMDVRATTKKKEEVEVRKITNNQSVGAGG